MTVVARTIAILLAGFAFATGASEKKPLGIADVLELELATDPRLSPDARHVVYVRQFVDPIADQRRSNLWIVGADGTGERPLTTGNYSDASARWAPDGKSLLYVSDRDGTPQIYRLWIDGNTNVKLTHLTTAPSGVSWSPDGQSIAFVALVPDPAAPIKDMPAPPPTGHLRRW
jgi:dipeptidyl aminopeptidase/acylaminoacyl peptidase